MRASIGTRTAAAPPSTSGVSTCSGLASIGDEETLEVAVLDVGLDADNFVATRAEDAVRLVEVVGGGGPAKAPCGVDPHRHGRLLRGLGLGRDRVEVRGVGRCGGGGEEQDEQELLHGFD